MTVWVPLVTGIVSAIAALAGVGLAHRFTHRRWLQERADDRRIEQRDAVIELLDAARVWDANLGGMLLAIAMLGGDLNKLSSGTSSVKDYIEPRRRVGLALARAQLTVTEAAVLRIVEALAKIVDDVPHYTDEVSKAAKRGSDGKTEASRIAFRLENANKKLLEELQRVAIETYSVSSPQQPSRWNRLRRKRPGTVQDS